MKRFVSIIGPNREKCNTELYQFGIDLGKYIVDHQWGIVCGGKFGFMEAICKGAHLSPNKDTISTIGIIPDETADCANSYVDFVLPTGLSFARNTLVVRAGEIIIAAGGGAGTLSEIALAWQLEKKIICFSQYGGWSKELAGLNLDCTVKEPIINITSLDELNKYL